MDKTTLLVAAVFIMLVPVISLAAELPEVMETTKSAATQAGLSGVENDAPLATVIGGVIQGFLGALGIVFFALLIYAGTLWMTASGNEDQVGKAKKIISSAVIGLVIIMAAYAVTSFIVGAVQESIR